MKSKKIRNFRLKTAPSIMGHMYNLQISARMEVPAMTFKKTP